MLFLSSKLNITDCVNNCLELFSVDLYPVNAPNANAPIALARLTFHEVTSRGPRRSVGQCQNFEDDREETIICHSQSRTDLCFARPFLRTRHYL